MDIAPERLVSMGYDSCAASCGRFMVLDRDILEFSCGISGLHVMPLKTAFEVYPHVRENLLFGLIPKDKNDFTKMASRVDPVGYYVRVEKGVKIADPMQAAFLFGGAHQDQLIHNIIELEEGASLDIVNGCANTHAGTSGRHIGITETYLGKGSSLGYTMIHNWGPDMEVYPVGAVQVGEGARYLSNYVSTSPVKRIETYPKATVGPHASARYYSIIYARQSSYFDTGAFVALEGEGSSGEIISRVVSEGGTVISRQTISGETKGCIGHMECSGLLLAENGVIHSIPELRGKHPDIDLSHEASIGRISDEEVSYLMTRGLGKEEARSLIIRGFLDVKIAGLPDRVKVIVDEVIEQAMSGKI
ncbi:MAG TPA: SufD family Fe-S cluster assembly protein [Deltaproteobacteria bacterium]|nr:SufD family Fe-S cluster assembly protein [Deltaproteobacteria bacterium]HOM29385.1 SufD family Fe-S cluster assembly protein [Deltaproteobacteria bacterium]HPP81736.1 SufD family Fe-S cluster assembly protein [Deltaproteobacteria bacterium]